MSFDPEPDVTEVRTEVIEEPEAEVHKKCVFHRYEVGATLGSTNGVEYHVEKNGAFRRVDGKKRMSRRAQKRLAVQRG